MSGKGIDAFYEGETGDNLALRHKLHNDAVKGKVLSNGLAKHLQIHHSDKVGDISHFCFKSAEYFIDILAFEGFSIHNSDADIKVNSRSEFHQPAVPRVALTIEVQERDTCRTIFNLFSLSKIPNHPQPYHTHSQSNSIN